MKQLQERIIREGRVMPGGIINVDGFLNHGVDTRFLGELAEELSRRMDLTGVTKIFTAEASGIPLATVCAYKLGVPMVFAKKVKGEIPEGPHYKSTIFSFTYQRPTTLVCSVDRIGPEDKVLIVDDFLANGQAIRGLIDIAGQAGAQVVGIAVAIEKGFQSGGARLRADGHHVEALAIIDKADESGFTFR